MGPEKVLIVRDSMKTAASLWEPWGDYFRQKNNKGKGQHDDSSLGHDEFEVTFIYPEGDIHEAIKLQA